MTLQFEGTRRAARMRAIMDAVRAEPPAALLGRPVTAVDDLLAGARGLPRSDVLVLRAEGARVVIRPSGTEPKLKAYLEVVVDGDRRPRARRSPPCARTSSASCGSAVYGVAFSSCSCACSSSAPPRPGWRRRP